jgi:L-aspartate oxidase
MHVGIDMTKQAIPVVPAAHYMCGGIKVDKNGNSSIQNLYAVGECSSTGLHGANRLASNSLPEALVYAHRASLQAVSKIGSLEYCEGIPDWNDEGTEYPEEMILITQSLKEVQSVMASYVGIVRSDIRLQRALRRLEIIYGENEALYQKTIVSQKLCESRNLINIAYLITKAAMHRKESRGLHFTVDYPSKEAAVQS